MPPHNIACRFRVRKFRLSPQISGERVEPEMEFGPAPKERIMAGWADPRPLGQPILIFRLFQKEEQ